MQRASGFSSSVAGVVLAPFSSAAAAEPYKLGPGDKLRIKVHEWPDLSGEYLVSPAATVSLPVIGELPAGGTTTRELAKAVSDGLREAAKLNAQPSSTVEVVQFRPFFVMGDVQTPGEYAYRPGLTVLQAVSIAGGYYRPSETMFRLERDAISAKGDILVRSREERQLKARIARLEAEQKTASDIDFPSDLDASAGSPDRVLMNDEQAILAGNNDTHAKTLDTLDRYVTLYEQEIETIKAQIASEKRQLASVKKEFESIKSLADRGLASLSRQLASERTLAQIDSTVQGLEATILRARQNISQTEQRRIEVVNNRTDRINRDLQKARADAKEVDYRMKTARDLLYEAQVVAPALYSTDKQHQPPAGFTIARGASDAAEQLSVDATAPVMPGDVLTVDRRRVQSNGQSSLAGDAGIKTSANDRR